MNVLSREDSYLLLEDTCRQIVESNAIMVQQPLVNLMKLIAYNAAIEGCVMACYRGINYPVLLAKCQRLDDSGYHFVLPDTNRAVVALVSKLLYDFCMGTQNLQTFTGKIYPQCDVRTGFVRFCEDIIMPYKEAFREVLLNQVDESEEEAEQQTVAGINSVIVAEIGSIAGDIRSELMGDNHIKQDVRMELIALIDGLCEVVESDLPKLVLPSWLGIRYAFGAQRKCQSSLARLKKTLQDYLLT